MFQQRVGRLWSGEGKNATYSPVAVGAHNAQPTTPTRRSTCARNRRCADVGASPILWSALGVSTTSHLSACRGVLDMFSEAVSPTSAPTIPFRRCVLAYVRWHGSRRGDMSMTRNGRTRRGSRGQARENADCADLRLCRRGGGFPCGTSASGARGRHNPRVSLAHAGHMSRTDRRGGDRRAG